jgi:hypothetical protein
MSGQVIREWLARRDGGAGNAPRKGQELPGGIVVEESAAMGKVLTVPADPRPGGLDLSQEASGWESWAQLRRRLQGG